PLAHQHPKMARLRGLHHGSRTIGSAVRCRQPPLRSAFSPPIPDGYSRGETQMPLPADTDATTPKYLRDKYAIVGVGETTYTRGSGRSTRAMGTIAVRNAMQDAGLKPTDIDGMLSYSGNDSTPSTFLAGDLGIRLNFFMDVNGGGSSTEALI